MKFTLTTTCMADGRKWQSETKESGAPIWGRQINLYPEYRKQTMRGFGGAFTEAAGYALSQLPEEKREEVIDWYFGEDGLRYSLCRTHMNSCDFSLGNWACVEDPNDTELKTFTLENDEKYILPMLRMAMKRTVEPIRLLLSPWSPPAFMKTNNEMNNGGKLRPEFAHMWARIIARYVKEYRKLGMDVAMVSIQNEPDAVQTWDSCIYSAKDEADFVRDHLGPVFHEEGLTDVGIMIWDHNKDMIWDRATTTLGDAQAAKDIASVGFHWYGGDHFEAVRMVKEAFPDKELYFTEGCVEYSRFADRDSVTKAEMYAHEMIGNACAGTCGFIDWNLMLDENGGPNHVGNFCESPVMLDGKGGVERKLTYYYLGHVTRFVKNGAQLIGHSTCCAEAESAAFVNPDGSRVTVVLNRTDLPQTYSITESGVACTFEMPAHSIVTCSYTH